MKYTRTGGLCMLSGILADIVVFAHLLWVFFLIAGAYWGRKHQLVKLVQGAGLGFSVVSQVFGWYCPLTYLEVWLRKKQAAARDYPGSFIAHYAEKLVYIELSPAIILVLTLALVGINVLIYKRALTRTGSSE